MLRFVADENFNGRIVRGLKRVLPELDLIRIQDTPLVGAGDPEILEWAASQGRIVLTHDVSTFTRFANDRVRDGRIMRGVVEIPTMMAIGPAIKDLQLLATASLPEDLENQVRYLPL